MDIYSVAFKAYPPDWGLSMIVIRKLRRIDGILYWVMANDTVGIQFRRKYPRSKTARTEKRAREIAEEMGLPYIGKIPSIDRVPYKDYPL